MIINIEITQTPDAEKLAALHAECFPAGWDAAAIRDILHTATTRAFVAPDHAGFGLLRVVAEEAEMLTLAVGRSHRRQGIAGHIVAAMYAWAQEQGAHAVFLEVRESNEAARALYRKAGFRETGLRKGYYPTGESTVLMRIDVK